MSVLDDLRLVERRIAALDSLVSQAPRESATGAGVPRSTVAQSTRSEGAKGFSTLVDLVRRAALREGVEPALAQAVASVESAFNPRAVSPTGARGLMQLMPATAAALGVGDIEDPERNARGGARYLHALSERFGGDLRLTLAAYNAGPGAVERYGGIPPYAETRAYVRRVLATYQTLKTSS